MELLYIRKPKTPKWTYNIVAGNPMYNAGASDKQDIDLHQSLYPKVVVKILQYAGLSLREMDIVQASEGEEVKIIQKQS